MEGESYNISLNFSVIGAGLSRISSDVVNQSVNTTQVVSSRSGPVGIANNRSTVEKLMMTAKQLTQASASFRQTVSVERTTFREEIVKRESVLSEFGKKLSEKDSELTSLRQSYNSILEKLNTNIDYVQALNKLNLRKDSKILALQNKVDEWVKSYRFEKDRSGRLENELRMLKAANKNPKWVGADNIHDDDGIKGRVKNISRGKR